MRWRRVTLAEVRILLFAICHELQIDLWQRPAGPRRLRRLPYDRRDAVHKKAVAGPGTAQHKSRLLQAALIAAQARWRGAACTETAGPKPTINVPKMTAQIRFRCIFIAPGGCQLVSRTGAEFSEYGVENRAGQKMARSSCGGFARRRVGLMRHPGDVLSPPHVARHQGPSR